ncbi:MAG TPA: DUF1549 domain-containing protein [Lacipirellulaceae bacterium]|jgi:hypothetical protein|nr:DUF1549 domain-containing protein [Lacipirellulaceae bacterium]
MNLRPCGNWLRLGLGLLFGCILTAPVFAKPSAAETARQVDQLLADEVFKDDTKLAPRASDATFLRRVWLDIVGDIPTPEHVTAFLIDPDPQKRERVVRELLDNPQYGQNWARYWRDVILVRRLEDRAAIVANSLVVTLTEKLNENESWDKVAAEFITATGDVKENGATAIQMAQDGRTEETAAEMSRIFLGIQIQCCQCHDHPYDSWKREQFHEFAAFFPRIAVRPVLAPTRRSFEVLADDGPERRRPNPNAEGRRGQAEHYMPDLNDPAAPGTRMQPKFFLSSAKLKFGTLDAERRATLARWMTKSPWFATAFVNRMWAELVGEGFYEPIDDIGPERSASAPKTVELVSRSFAESGYDVKWLVQTICATEAYQRECRPRREVDGTPFVANVAQPLRSDQLYNALLTAADADESDESQNRRGRRRPQMMGPYGRAATARTQFETTFGYDPSDPRETVTSSIPQALAMMNGMRINLAVRAIGRETVLGRLLDEITENEPLVEELYLRTLSREPTEKEMKTAIQFVRSTPSRSAAFEDLYWALLNSSEFSHRR